VSVGSRQFLVLNGLLPKGWRRDGAAGTKSPARPLQVGTTTEEKSMSDPVLPQLLIVDQLAEKLGVTRRHVRRLVTERRVPFLRVGRFIRFHPADIARWLDRARVAASRPL